MTRRGFTLIELAIVLSCAAVVVPVGYMLVRSIEAEARIGLADLDAAAAARGFSQEIRRDLATLAIAEGAGLQLEGACGKVRYVAEDGVLWRRAEGSCGPDRALASHVEALVREPEGVFLRFSRPVNGPDLTHTGIFVAIEGGQPPVAGVQP